MSLYEMYNGQAFFCDICDFPVDDIEIAKNWNCCEECYLKFIEADKAGWKSGKRPKKGIVDRYILAKKKLIFSNFKGTI